MYLCHCSKKFETQKALNAHQVAHKGDQQRYSISRRKNQSLYRCLQCNTEFAHKNNSTNKFCSSKCSGLHQWETLYVPKIEQGLGGNLKRYLKEKVGNICSRCGLLPTWFGQDLVLQLDHIDGNSDNNFPFNIRLLCPNCHTQTDTFCTRGGKKNGNKITKRNSYLRKYQTVLDIE